MVNGSNTSGADLEYYAFGNPQPTFDPTTNALTSLSVQVVGAAYDPTATNHYLFDQETINRHPEQRLPHERLVVQLRVLQLDRQLLDLQLQLEAQLQHQRRRR